jgi:hypothetical protein
VNVRLVSVSVVGAVGCVSIVGVAGSRQLLQERFYSSVLTGGSCWQGYTVCVCRGSAVFGPDVGGWCCVLKSMLWSAERADERAVHANRWGRVLAVAEVAAGLKVLQQVVFNLPPSESGVVSAMVARK